MKALYKMNFDCGRQGSLEGVFVADTEDVKYLVDNKISAYFGEALGKHSQVYGPICEDEIKQITTDEKVISIFEEYDLQSGYNPFETGIDEKDTEGIPDTDHVEFGEFTVKEYIDYRRDGIIPEIYTEDCYKEEYKELVRLKESWE